MNSQMKEKSKQSSMWSIDSATSGGPASGCSKWSVSKVHAWLKYDLDFRTHRNYHLSLGNVFKIINNTFYYGKFEFPLGDGIWYEGKHTHHLSLKNCLMRQGTLSSHK